MNEDAIEAMAAGWLVEREEGFAAGRAAAFAQWMEADARHRAAVARLEATHELLLQLPRALEDERLARRLDPRAKPARAKIIPFPYLIMAAAAAIAFAAIVWFKPARHDFQQEFATTADGATKVTLPDTSRIDLNPDSDVVVNYSAHERDIALTRGEANFSVAKDASRPFIVAAGKIKVRAVGTVFKVVRHGPTSVEVVVTEGKVQVSRADAISETVVSTLVAGQRIELSPDAASNPNQTQAAVAAAEPKGIEMLNLEGRTLGEAVKEFNRRNKLQLIIDDPELANQKVGGTFPANDPDGFVRILEQNGELSSERTYDSRVLKKAN